MALSKNIQCIGLGVSVLLLSACQPPPSGESAGWNSLYLYWKLSQTELNVPVVLPVKGVSANQLVDTWGAARSAGRKHEGVDIFAQRGTEVLSTTEGIVRKVGTNTLGGQVIWITGPNLTQHYYAHLDRYADHLSLIHI